MLQIENGRRPRIGFWKCLFASKSQRIVWALEEMYKTRMKKVFGAQFQKEEKDMSYNCSNFKVKKIENFRIPISGLYESDDPDWYFSREDNDDGTTTFYKCETEISGEVDDGILTVNSIDCSGEGSGIILGEILEPTFVASEGELIVICVWEGGDSIEKLTVKDGCVSWEGVEL